MFHRTKEKISYFCFSNFYFHCFILESNFLCLDSVFFLDWLKIINYDLSELLIKSTKWSIVNLPFATIFCSFISLFLLSLDINKTMDEIKRLIQSYDIDNCIYAPLDFFSLYQTVRLVLFCLDSTYALAIAVTTVTLK